MVAEHSSKSPLAERYGELVQTRTLKQGDAALSFTLSFGVRLEATAGVGAGTEVDCELDLLVGLQVPAEAVERSRSVASPGHR